MPRCQHDSRIRQRRRRNRSQRIVRSLTPETLETRVLLAGDLMQNPALVTDVNNDGYTSPMDALHVINELNTTGARALAAMSAEESPSLFYDVNGDAFLTPVDALIVLNALNAEGENDALVQFRIQPTDLQGNDISQIAVGEDFLLEVFVQDLTGRANGGVFAAYLDVLYDENLVSIDGNIVHSDTYEDATSGDTETPGLIDEVGAIDGLQPLGADEFLLVTIPMRADSDGLAEFTGDPPDILPLHEVLVYNSPEGTVNGKVPNDRLMFVGATLQVGEVQSPVASDDDYSTPQGQTLVVSALDGVLANDTAPGGAAMMAVRVDDVSNGSLTLANDGSFSYTPDPGFVGTDSFTYRATTVASSSNLATVTIEVFSENTPPVAVDDTGYEVAEGDVLVATVSVLDNDSDADGDALTARRVSGPSNGVLQLNQNGLFTYTPSAGFSGTDTFVYVANDGQADSNQATVTIEVTSTNQPPIAEDDSYTAGKNTPLVVNAANGVLANDTDPDGDALTAKLVNDVQHGNLTLNSNGSFTYTPDQDFLGQDTFTYVANDGRADSLPAVVTILVTGDFEVRFRLQTTDLAGVPISSVSPGEKFLLRGLISDVSALPRDGVFAAYMDVTYDSDLVSVDGTITFDSRYPNTQSGDTSTAGLIDEVGAFDGLKPLGPDEIALYSVPMVAGSTPGIATFATDEADILPLHQTLLYNVQVPVDPSRIEYGTTTLTIVAGDPPVASDDDYETNEDVTLVIANPVDGVLANDSDPSGGTLVAILVADASHGTVQLNPNGTFTYTPDLNFNGNDAFTYRASNGTQSSNVATVTIVVNPVDDGPIAVDDEYRLEGLDPLVVDAVNGVLANDSDPEGNPLTAVLVEGPTDGTLQFSSDGSFTYTPGSGFFGRDEFTYRAVANGKMSGIATVRIDVGDLDPGSVAGYVYVDANNNGVMGSLEKRIGGVEVRLTGVDVLGDNVSLTTFTAADGSYSFGDVLPGRYTITEFQPQFMVDGKDTYQGQLSLRNDRFEVSLTPGKELSGYNFGERGLEPEFILNPLFFASRETHGVTSMVDPAGNQLWYVLGDGWTDLDHVEVKLSGSGATLELTAESGNDVDSAVVRVTGNRDVWVHGDSVRGRLVRMFGNPEDFGINLAEGESLSAAAVDAAFGGDDA